MMGCRIAFDRAHKTVANWSVFVIILTLSGRKCCGAAGHGWHSKALLQTAPSSTTNCTKIYTTTASETCETLQSAVQLSPPQLLELNPRLNCKSLLQGLEICVAGLSSRCNTSIVVQKGPTNETCASIAAEAAVSSTGLSILNPGLTCPETTGNNSWLSSGSVCTSPGFGVVLIEYIGGSGRPITFSDVQPLVQNFNDLVFHLALAFASDTTANGTAQPGNFTPHWAPELDPLSAQEFKADNPGARLVASIGGAYRSTGGQLVGVEWVDPPNPDQWIQTAENSLTALANDYLLDGIDVNYQTISNNSNSFAYCLGTLIQRLKANKTIGVATIAPYGATLQPYLNLMYSFGDLIDYVAFQFYEYDLPNAEAYIQEFNSAAFYFPPWKLLASLRISGNNSISGRAFSSVMVQLAGFRGLPGVAVFEADDSLLSQFTDQTGILGILNDPSVLGRGTTAPPPARAPVRPPEAGGEDTPPGATPPPPSPDDSSAPGSNRRRAPATTLGYEVIVSLTTGLLLLWLPFRDTLI